MNKIILCILFYVSIIIFFSCNDNGKHSGDANHADSIKADSVKKNSPEIQSSQVSFTKSLPGIDNLIVDGKEAQKMIDHFKDIFHNKDRVPTVMKFFKDSIWIDSCVLNPFSRYINSSSENFDGVSIICGHKRNDSSTIILCPTSGNGIDKHTEQWVVAGFKPSKTDYKFKDFNLKRTKANGYANAFRIKYRKEFPFERKIDSLSRKIWIHKEVISALTSLLDDSANKLDGIKIYFGAYDKKIKGTYQSSENQSTILIAPTNDYIGNWTIIKQKFDFSNVVDGLYNHGQLCPTQCNN